MRKAALFARFKHEDLQLIIDGRRTMPGVYPITFKYGEIIQGVMMPPTTFEITLNVTALPIPRPKLERIRQGFPVGRIESF